jgi:hypothetical protein
MELTVKSPNGLLRVPQADRVLRHATLATLRHRFARAKALAIGIGARERRRFRGGHVRCQQADIDG